MPDLNVVAVIAAKPGSEAIVRGALDALVTASRAESGCTAYALHESLAAPGTFVTIEAWTDQAALDAHLASPQIAAALATTGEHLSAPPAIHPLTPVNV